MSSIRGSSWLRSAQGLGSGRRGAAYGKLPPVRPPVQRATKYGKLAPVRPPGQSPGGSPLGQQPPRRSLAERALSRQSPLRHLDYVLLATVLALSLVGTLLVWSATQPGLRLAGADPRTYLYKQLLNIGIGLILMAIVSMLDYRQLRLYAPILYGLSCLGLLAVLTPLGTAVNGATAWISLPVGFQIEPSEFGKLAIILMSAAVLSELRQADSRPRMRAVALAIGIAVVPIGLVVLEPDLGVTVLMAVLVIGLIALSGIRLRWLVGLAVAATAAVLAVLNLHLLQTYQLHRLTAFLNPSADPRGTGYSAAQAKIAIGSGGLFGQGLFHGQLIAGNFVPEQHTDFIFAVAGEELGFAGAVLIIGLLAVLLLRALRIAARADDQFGMLVAAGIAIWLAVQAFINIGMTVGIMPVTGLPLPFVSYGGSAMFADMIAVGALNAVHRHRSVFS
ncbi:MAG: rod shape-determining protein RodA [Streptosporangiaceae bacterium]|jgi:rod shape determining protein RodA